METGAPVVSSSRRHWPVWRWLLLPVDLCVLSFEFLRLLLWYLRAGLLWLMDRQRSLQDEVFLPCVPEDWITVDGVSQRCCQPGRKYANPFVLGLLCAGVDTAAVGRSGVCALCQRQGSLGVTWVRLLWTALGLSLVWGLLLGGGLFARAQLYPAPPVVVQREEPAALSAPLTTTATAEESPTISDEVGLPSDWDTPTEPSSEALVLLSESALAGGKRDEARTAAEKALQLAPDDPRAQVQMACVEMADGHFAVAAEAFRKVLGVLPTQVEAAAGLAQALLGQGDTKGALAQAEAVLRLAPGNLEAATVLAEATLAGGDRAAATEMFATLHREHPAEIGPGARYVDLLLRAKQGSEALTVARKLATERPGEADAQLVLGDAYLRLNLPDQALECCQSALRYHPHAAIPHLLLARIQMAKKDSAGAARELEGLRKLAPNDINLTLALAACREAEGKREEAARLCEEAAAAHPGAVSPWLRLARLQTHLGRAAEALESTRQALAKAPDNPLVMNGLALLIVEQGGDLSEAFALATRAHGLAPERPLIAATLGWICHLQHDEARALELLGRARGALPRNALVRYHYAATLAALGRTEEAARELAPVLALPAFREREAALKLSRELPADVPAAAE